MGYEFTGIVVLPVKVGVVVGAISPQDELRHFIWTTGGWEELDDSFFSRTFGYWYDIPDTYPAWKLEGRFHKLGDGRSRIEIGSCAADEIFYFCPNGFVEGMPNLPRPRLS